MYIKNVNMFLVKRDCFVITLSEGVRTALWSPSDLAKTTLICHCERT